ncbi:AEC family transporter [Georgenia alba]|uniref:AEC family transporter n=1 Tax=Georgenia alba TaxID=2233858 RepID=A0ABW2Q6T7_9MICO
MRAAVGALLPFFVLLGVGLVLGRFARFRDAEPILTAFVFYVALPCFLFDTLAGTDPAGSGVPVGMLAVAVAVAALVATALALPLGRGRRRGAGSEVALAAGYANVGYLGIPVAVGLLGEGAGLAAGLAQLAHNVVFMVGYPVLAIARRGRGEGLGPALWETTRRAILLNPVTISVAAGLLVAHLGIRPPHALTASIDLLAGAAVPGALVAVGLTLGPSLRALTSGGVRVLDVGAAVTTKLLLLPVATWGALALLAPRLDATWTGTLVLMAAMPTSTTAFVLAREYGGDGRTAAATIAASTLAAMLTIPLVAALLLP